MDQEQQEGQGQQSGGALAPRWLLWAGILVALAFLIIMFFGYLRGWKWTGLPGQTVWDWLDLLIVPIVLAVGGYLFTRTENQRTLQSSKEQREVDRKIAKDQVKTDRTLADERRQDDTLQAYLDGLSLLLTDKERPLHSAQSGDSLSTVARARTLTVLGRLDSGRKRSVLQFLFESGLIYKEYTLLNESDLIERRHNIVNLQQADLRGANLREANLSEANLGGVNLIEASLIGANLSEVDLRKANLSEANLGKADLGGASLGEADLREANLGEADLRKANLVWANLRVANLREAKLGRAFLGRANLSEANLGEAFLIGADLRVANLGEASLGEADMIGADLRWARLTGTNLHEANLGGANLSGAIGSTEHQLRAAKSLEGATMPNGRKYEDWLKSKDRAGDR